MTPCCSEWLTTVPETIRFINDPVIDRKLWVVDYNHKYRAYRISETINEITEWLTITKIDHRLIKARANDIGREHIDLIFENDIDCSLFKMAFNIR